uniref:Uncharacterized protein n=1 Tax=Heliothis virescens TaxID=7102 RepID=A0A2A4JZA2_HELVI
MDFKCKCSCHELKTTTILPFFKWRTNGTTKTWARTHSPNLYHLVGTLSPATYPDYDELEGNVTTLAVDSGNSTADGGNSTDVGGGNATVLDDGAGGAGNADGNSSDVGGANGTEAATSPAA